jgi:threonyl-tRNA synthetase
LRVEIDAGDNSLGARIHRVHDRRAPYIAVVGDNEVHDGSLALRLRDGRRLSLPGAEALAEISRVVAARGRCLGFELD